MVAWSTGVFFKLSLILLMLRGFFDLLSTSKIDNLSWVVLRPEVLRIEVSFSLRFIFIV